MQTTSAVPNGADLSTDLAIAATTQAFVDASGSADEVWRVAMMSLGALLGAVTAAWHEADDSCGFSLVAGPTTGLMEQEPLLAIPEDVRQSAPWLFLRGVVSVGRVIDVNPRRTSDNAGWDSPTDRDAIATMLDSYGLGDGLAIPVVGRDRQIGLLLAARRVGEPSFSASDRSIARQVSSCAALALECARAELRAEETRPSGLHCLIEAMTLLSDAVVTTDLEGNIIGWNDAASALYSCADVDAIGRKLGDVLPTSPVGRATMRSLRDRLQSQGRWSGELNQITADGRPVRVSATSTVVDVDQPGQPCVVTIVRDDSEWRTTLGRQEAVSKSMLDALPAPTALVAPGGRVESVNRAWTLSMIQREGPDATCGIGANYLHACAAAVATGDLSADAALHGILAVLRGERSTFVLDYECSDGSGESWYSMQVSPVRGGGAVISHYDITQIRQANGLLEHAAAFDDLTDLPNRQSLTTLLDSSLGRTDQERSTTSNLMLIDITRFRVINDGLGQSVGDQVLQLVADRLREAIDTSDYLARYGGDRFAVFAERATAEGATTLATSIRTSIARPMLFGKRSLEMRVAIGIAATEPGDATESVLAAADDALHQAKRLGIGRTVAISTASSPARGTLDAELELRSAIDDGQLAVQYQAVIDARRRRIEGFEALVRWNHPTRGWLGPGAFIPLAEATGLIVPLGAWVLDAALAVANTWPTEQSIAVNVAPLQVTEDYLTTTVEAAIARHRIDPHRLILEVTESALLADDQRVTAALGHLRELGVRIAVDDFGTGYSSFSYLRRLPVDILKIDKSFIDDLPGSGEPIVASIIGLASALQLDVIAEGVERDDQLATLDRLGCRLIQGFLFHLPTSAGDLCPDLGTASCNNSCQQNETTQCTDREVRLRRPSRVDGSAPAE